MDRTGTIAVVGAGYAGLFAARRAAQAITSDRRDSVRIVLVDRERAWVERTRWHQLAAGERVSARPLEALFRGTGVEVLTGDVASLDLEGRTIAFAGDRKPPLSFDRLVLAAGSRSTAPQVTGVEKHGHCLDTPASSRRVAAALAERPTGRVAVVGGGLTGIQAATQIAELHSRAEVTLPARATWPGSCPTGPGRTCGTRSSGAGSRSPRHA